MRLPQAEILEEVHQQADFIERQPDYEDPIGDGQGNLDSLLTAAQDAGKLWPETSHDVRTLSPGWDVYMIEREWREWMTEPSRDPDAAFLGICKKWYERRGRPA